jgi:hypothetical protein
MQRSPATGDRLLDNVLGKSNAKERKKENQVSVSKIMEQKLTYGHTLTHIYP